MGLFDEAGSEAADGGATDAQRAEERIALLANLAEQWAWRSVVEEIEPLGAVGPDLERRQLKFGVMAAYFKLDRFGPERVEDYLERLSANPTSGPIERIYIRLIKADLALYANSRATGEWSNPLDEALDEAKPWALSGLKKDPKRWQVGEAIFALRQACYDAQARNGTLAPFLGGSVFCQVENLRLFLELPPSWLPDAVFQPLLIAPRPAEVDPIESPTGGPLEGPIAARAPNRIKPVHKVLLFLLVWACAASAIAALSTLGRGWAAPCGWAMLLLLLGPLVGMLVHFRSRRLAATAPRMPMAGVDCIFCRGPVFATRKTHVDSEGRTFHGIRCPRCGLERFIGA